MHNAAQNLPQGNLKPLESAESDRASRSRPAAGTSLAPSAIFRSDPFGSTLEASDHRVRNLDRQAVLLRALRAGIEIGMGGVWLRLFNAGDVVRTPSGYFEVDEPRLMYRVLRGDASSLKVAGCGHDAGVYVDTVDAGGSSAEPLAWLGAQADLLSDACVAKIAAACELQIIQGRNTRYEAKKTLDVPASNVIAFRRPG